MIPDKVLEAIQFASREHHGQMRKDGKTPYVSHPYRVMFLLRHVFKVEDPEVLTAGVLHDTIEDTSATRQEIDELFGEDIGRLVEGLTKIKKLDLVTKRAKQAENLRKLLLAISDDVRVLLVKLADRLHNMRTLHFITSSEKRHRIALETMDIYAPLAERIGIQEMKQELEDLAFSEINLEAHQSILKRLDFLRTKGEGLIDSIIIEIQKLMSDNGINASVFGREKTPYSIWKKMNNPD